MNFQIICVLLCTLILNLSCTSTRGSSGDTSSQLEPDQQEKQRLDMVARQIEDRGISHKAVLDAIRKVPRHRFVPANVAEDAYQDRPLPIGYGQTISQPYIVAYMTALLEPKPDDKVLEVGSGSGYQAAVLSKLVREVYSIEIVKELAEFADKNLKASSCTNVHVKAGDGYRGWPEAAPFDAIIVTAAPDHIPQPLIDQLKPGGKLVIPVGNRWQSIRRITRTTSGIKSEDLESVIFVPMTGEAQGKKP